MGTSTLFLHSSGIFSPARILLNKLVKNSTATSPRCFHISTGMSSGPTAFPFFILFYLSNFPFLVIATSWSTTLGSSTLPSLSISSFVNSSKYYLHLSSTLLAPVNIFPSLSLITLTCCTSYPSLSLANLYRSFSPSLVPNLAYMSSYAFCLAFALRHISMYSFLLSSVLSVSHFFLANLFPCIISCTLRFHHKVSFFPFLPEYTPSTLLPVSLIPLAVVVQSSGSSSCPLRACLTCSRIATQHSSCLGFHHMVLCSAFVFLMFLPTTRVILHTTILCCLAMLSPNTNLQSVNSFRLHRLHKM
ncbi:uncharacterized protein LOC133481222 [Phyllopteryx taeniolatus]|uniref:uncharacterized protein LOC133481222 n=1 Tax=Phyllopteryx taeniolatus TaxID=161469 RepID=UPI002AD30193|nr:uncharacterized protein LOC133481222 [Phyllopteryx taeniolatus]